MLLLVLLPQTNDLLYYKYYKSGKTEAFLFSICSLFISITLEFFHFLFYNVIFLIIKNGTNRGCVLMLMVNRPKYNFSVI